MKDFIIKRIFVSLVLLIFASGITFFLLELAPGDPAVMLLGQDITKEGLAQLRTELGLDKSIYERYFIFVTSLIQGDLGVSFETRRPVVQEIKGTFPATLELAAASMFMAILIGVPIGITSAVRQYSLVDRVIRFSVLLAVSLPIFWLGLILIYFFAVVLGLFPSFGRGSWRHIILPASTMACYSIAVIVRMTRSSMLEVLRNEYITTARSKGIPEFFVVYKHALRNAMIPVVTIIGLQFGVLLGGAVITETVFAWPGLGRLMVQAIFSRDYPIIRAGILLIAGCFIGINLLVDILYGYIDPSVRLSQRR
ncbi:MAG: ABC transporter permease [Thermodesulfobacteriota bacterium]